MTDVTALPERPEPETHNYDDDYSDGCDNCGGEGFYYSCDDEIGCADPESGCDLCRRRCDWCSPRPRDKGLDDVLAESLRAMEAHDGE